jgi:hypothetical protein
VVDVEHCGIEVDGREAVAELLRVQPVRRGAAAIEQARGGQDEGSGAQRRHTGTVGVCFPDRRDEARGQFLGDIADRRDDDGVRCDERGVGVAAVRDETAAGTYGA